MPEHGKSQFEYNTDHGESWDPMETQFLTGSRSNPKSAFPGFPAS